MISYIDSQDGRFPISTSAGWYYALINNGDIEDSKDSDGFINGLQCPSNEIPRIMRTQYGINYSYSKGVYVFISSANPKAASINSVRSPSATMMHSDSTSANYVSYKYPNTSNGLANGTYDVTTLHNGGLNVVYVAGNAERIENILMINAGESDKFPFWYRKRF
jgi:hypothetical protein